VGRVATEFGLQEVLEDIGAKWAAEEGPGLRPLARTFNTQVVHERLLHAGERSLDGEADLLYQLLTDDDVEDAERARARQRLAEQGIDSEELLGSFVSYRTIDRHFRDCADRERERSSAKPTPEKTIDRISALKNRLKRVTETALGQVTDEREASEQQTLDIMVQVTVGCPDCSTRLPIRKFLTDGCNCGSPARSSSIPAAERAESDPVGVISREGGPDVE
jgi:hypothetical protein